MIRRFTRVLLALHVLYAVLWIAMDGGEQRVFERYAVLVAEIVAVLFYAVLVIAFYEAQKTRLNLALAIQKLFWLFLVGLVALPGTLGLVINDVPYRDVRNPYALWSVPPWLRTYIWIGLAVSLIGVLYEFYRANWGDDPHPVWTPGDRDRRRNPYGRRRTDWPEGTQS